MNSGTFPPGCWQWYLVEAKFCKLGEIPDKNVYCLEMNLPHCFSVNWIHASLYFPNIIFFNEKLSDSALKQFADWPHGLVQKWTRGLRVLPRHRRASFAVRAVWILVWVTGCWHIKYAAFIRHTHTAMAAACVRCWSALRRERLH